MYILAVQIRCSLRTFVWEIPCLVPKSLLKDGKDLAWILVNHTGEPTFFNRNGDKSGYQLDDGLKTGSWFKGTDPNPVSLKDAIQSLASSAVSLPKLDSSSTAVPESSSTTQSGSSVGLCS
jgi:hypothetical protein